MFHAPSGKAVELDSLFHTLARLPDVLNVVVPPPIGSIRQWSTFNGEVSPSQAQVIADFLGENREAWLRSFADSAVDPLGEMINLPPGMTQEEWDEMMDNTTMHMAGQYSVISNFFESVARSNVGTALVGPTNELGGSGPGGLC